VKFLVDNQLPAALARFLSARGCECLHVLDVGLAKASDREIWQYATSCGFVLISKDEDFLYLAGSEKERAPLVWIRIGNCRKREMLEVIDRAWDRISEALQAGERVVEVR